MKIELSKEQLERLLDGEQVKAKVDGQEDVPLRFRFSDTKVEKLNRLHNNLPENRMLTVKEIKDLEKEQDKILKGD